MAELINAVSDRVVTTIAVSNEDTKTKVVIELDGLKKRDFYGTNLYLTGSTNWFGSGNMCNLLNDNSRHLFGKTNEGLCQLDMTSRNILSSEEGAHRTAAPSPSMTKRRRSFLELGSGLGRAGIMAAKLMSLYDHSFDSVVLTDGKYGEADLLPTLAENITRNSNSLSVPVSCQQLWWGTCPALSVLLEEHPLGFDLIIGADLIYGPKAEEAMASLLVTASTLLSWEGGTPHSRREGLSSEPCFLLAYMRSGSVPLDELFVAAEEHGLRGDVLEDFTWDIFGNNVETDSMFWSDAIIQFTRLPANVG